MKLIINDEDKAGGKIIHTNRVVIMDDTKELHNKLKYRSDVDYAFMEFLSTPFGKYAMIFQIILFIILILIMTFKK